MADPSPQIGLPNLEWIELKNTSTVPFNLQNWRIGDAGALSGPLPGFILQPDSFVIICTGSAVSALSVFGTAIPVTGFPSLDNDADQLFLRAPNGMTVHAIGYSVDWYQNDIKRNGGWTLEMIDPKSPCAGKSNWKASASTTGGTPGKRNSMDTINSDQLSPQLKSAFAIDDTTIILSFDETIDSVSASGPDHYSIDGGLSIVGAVPLSPLFNQVRLRITNRLQENTIYLIAARQVKDCKNNSIGENNTVRAGLPSDAAPGQCIINEILFNPRPNGYDYIECYNNSHRIFDASRLYIANRNSSGVISNVKVFSSEPYYMFPGDYIVITEDLLNLSMNYLVKDPDRVLMVNSMPSYPDDAGDVVILNFQGVVTDEVKYKDDWHFRLIADPEGVSLERVDPAVPSEQESNWHSAASTAGFGTPGYKNSQYKQPLTSMAKIVMSPRVFSPDNDGRDDIASIQYELAEPGFVANITIFDAHGNAVRNLVQNAMLGSKGYLNWDGIDNKGSKLPVGVYIVYIELFNLAGKKERFRNTLVLARPLK